MNHYLDIFMSGKNLGLNFVKNYQNFVSFCLKGWLTVFF